MSRARVEHSGERTRAVLSRAARATMSAQETTPGQTSSTLALIWSMTSYPRTELLFGAAVFSPTNPVAGTSSRRMDASQPWTKQSWKKRRMREAPIRRSAWMALATVACTTFSTDGQLSA